MLTRTKSVVLISALAAVLATQPRPRRALIQGSAQPLSAWVVPAAVAAAVVTVAIVATNEDALLQPPSH